VILLIVLPLEPTIRCSDASAVLVVVTAPLILACTTAHVTEGVGVEVTAYAIIISPDSTVCPPTEKAPLLVSAIYTSPTFAVAVFKLSVLVATPLNTSTCERALTVSFVAYLLLIYLTSSVRPVRFKYLFAMIKISF